jgi:hypothetical protein
VKANQKFPLHLNMMIQKLIPRVLLVACVIASAWIVTFAQTEEQYGIAYSHYEKEKDRTTIEVQRLDVGNPDQPHLYLNASVTFPGTRLSETPQFVIFIVQIGSADRYKYSDTVQMKVRIDGKPADDITVANLDKRMADKWFLETLGTRMKYEVFKSLAHAKSVELEVEGLTIPVSADKLAKFADLEKMIGY